MRFADDFEFTSYSLPAEMFEPTIKTFAAQPHEPETAAGPVIPVEDEDGGLWLCRETDDSCICIPF